MSVSLPNDFIEYTRSLFGEERWQRYLNAFDEPTPVSIRLNPYKTSVHVDAIRLQLISSSPVDTPVPWCRGGYYLSERPNFTLDPLFHAGAYYVQEASSMFLDHVVRQLSTNSIQPSTVLDLCAAPGGKSTLLRSAIPDDAVLYSNEPDRRRANILMENIQKQGHPNVIVTNNYPRDYRKSGMQFDMILADVPCSGEGMFRKDEGAIKEWSVGNVMKCQALQRSIIEDIWTCLRGGGIMVYSTCTFNTREDEENVRWIIENYDAEIVPIETNPDWNITGSLLEGFDAPVYRFIPGITKGEGLFMAVLRKKQGDGGKHVNKGKTVLKCLQSPEHTEALLVNTPKDNYARVELSKDDALRYLHREALVLPPDTPRGLVIVTYMGLPLGFVKNIGNRANNLYPKEWKIRNL